MHELWLSLFLSGEFCAFGGRFIIEAGNSRSASRSVIRYVQRRYGLTDLFTCAKDNSARYKEAGCEEGNERAQMIGKVHELLQTAEQPLTSGRHVT